jgi:nucleoside-diphosphate-sugar epimerase
MMQTVCVVGGAGYVGSVLVPKLLDRGYKVAVLDLFIYGDDVLLKHPNLFRIRGDVRDVRIVDDAFSNCDAVIHLACISNDPSFELDPDLGKSINYDSFRPLVHVAKAAGIKRFIYASSSSVYGVKSEPEVTEQLTPEPLTDYSKFKLMCEQVLLEEQDRDFTICIARPATVCGYAPRQRLDLIVNILTNHAVNTGKVTVLGGEQKRPNIHIQDMADAYIHLLEQPTDRIAGQIFNVGGDNYTVLELAQLVRLRSGVMVRIDKQPTNDPRSYRISSNKIQTRLGFLPQRYIGAAIYELAVAMRAGKLPNSMEDSRYFNIKRMQELGLK